MNKDARIVFLGTPEFAVPVLRALVGAGYPVVGVVSQPDRPVGRKRVLAPTPVKQAAQALGLSVLQPERIRSEEALDSLAKWQPDVLVTAAYGQLIPDRVLRLPRVAALNVHASLLPRYRGASPIQLAIMEGEKETGVSIMTMVREMDAGPVWAQARLAIGQNENYGELSERLARLGADLLLSTLPGVMTGTSTPMAQDEAAATYAPRLNRQDEWLNFHESADRVANRVRALAPAPGASAWLDGQAMKVWNAAPALTETVAAEPGQVIEVGERGLLVACGKDAVWVQRVQAAGKKAMGGLEFSRGRQGLAGSVFKGQKPGDQD